MIRISAPTTWSRNYLGLQLLEEIPSEASKSTSIGNISLTDNSITVNNIIVWPLAICFTLTQRFGLYDACWIEDKGNVSLCHCRNNIRRDSSGLSLLDAKNGE
jgi:hypothetical protein